MANQLDNFGDKMHKLTAEEASKGGQKSGETRRMQKLLKQCLAMTDNIEINGSKIELPNEVLVTLGLIKGAKNGNARNYETIVTMLGEAPNMIIDQQEEKKTPQIELTIVDNSNLESVMYEDK